MLNCEKLVLDWRKKQQAKADVQITIDEILDRLPLSYTKEVYSQLRTDVFQHVYESYFGRARVCMQWQVELLSKWYSTLWIFDFFNTLRSNFC